MNIDQIKGKAQNAFGKMEESVGNAIGNQNLANAGAEDRLKGAAKETWGNAKDTVNEVRDTAHTSAAVHADHATVAGESFRDKVVNGAENLKNSINAKLDHAKEDEQIKREEIRNRTV
jgi:uncharacterized protein YjbJ (UPF0337 family)